MWAEMKLVGGFNPFEKYESKWESSPSRGKNKKNETTTQEGDINFPQNPEVGPPRDESISTRR